MPSRGLVLPEPARTLWMTSRETIRRALEAIGAGEYRLGGGTILAARWQHRISFDVDVNVDPAVELRRLDDPAHAWFREEMVRLGAVPDYSAELNLYNLRFGEAEDEQAIQLWGHPLPLSAGHHPEVVEDGHDVVLSNAQVLRGKLQRAGHKLARDVYDVCTAADVDPESLEQAVNTFPHEQVEIRALDWLVGYGRIGRNAHERLRGVPKEAEAGYYELGKRGAAKLVESTYERLRIRADRGAIVIEAVTAGGARRYWNTSAGAAAEHFEAWGINGHLRGKGPGSAAIREYAADLARQPVDDVLVLEEQRDRLTRWRTKHRSENLPLITETRPTKGAGADSRRSRNATDWDW